MNHINIKHKVNKTLYEILKGMTQNLFKFHVFGYKCFVLNNWKNHLWKFDYMVDKGIFLGYSYVEKVYQIFNKRKILLKEAIHVFFDESALSSTLSELIGYPSA